MLIVRCPHCGKDQRTDPRITNLGDLTKKVKRCVYCGHSFRIHSSQVRSHIVKVEK
jgi:Zn ribbon nucleic-acid-binding protein